MGGTLVLTHPLTPSLFGFQIPENPSKEGELLILPQKTRFNDLL